MDADTDRHKDVLFSPDNPDALFNTDTKGVIEAVDYPDLIEALDADSAQEKVVQLIAMGMIARAFSRCEPPSEFLPTVPDRMREIRIEYRMPKGMEPDPSRRLRPWVEEILFVRATVRTSGVSNDV